jgi:predicted adenylyl cyclase CyaB
MAVEIELKAWVDDIEGVKERAASFARYERAYDKRDVYWRLADAGHGVKPFEARVRKEREGDVSRVLVTYKAKETRDRVEVNVEKEFTVSDAAPFEDMLAAAGFRAVFHKHKTGWAWRYTEDAPPQAPPVLIELSLVERVGWFAELEILAERDDAETVARARARLLACLARLGIGEDRIEARYYTEMLEEL